MAKHKRKKPTWRAAVGGYVRKQAKKAGRSLWASFKKDTLGIKPKRQGK